MRAAAILNIAKNLYLSVLTNKRSQYPYLSLPLFLPPRPSPLSPESPRIELNLDILLTYLFHSTMCLYLSVTPSLPPPLPPSFTSLSPSISLPPYLLLPSLFPLPPSFPLPLSCNTHGNTNCVLMYLVANKSWFCVTLNKV